MAELTHSIKIMDFCITLSQLCYYMQPNTFILHSLYLEKEAGSQDYQTYSCTCIIIINEKLRKMFAWPNTYGRYLQINFY